MLTVAKIVENGMIREQTADFFYYRPAEEFPEACWNRLLSCTPYKPDNVKLRNEHLGLCQDRIPKGLMPSVEKIPEAIVREELPTAGG